MVWAPHRLHTPSRVTGVTVPRMWRAGKEGQSNSGTLTPFLPPGPGTPAARSRLRSLQLPLDVELKITYPAPHLITENSSVCAYGNCHHNSSNNCVYTAPFFLGILNTFWYYLNYYQQPCEAGRGREKGLPARKPMGFFSLRESCVSRVTPCYLYYLSVTLPPILY